MAQTVFEKIIANAGDENNFKVDSAGLSNYHEGCEADPRMREHAQKRGYTISHLSRPVTPEDLQEFDYIIGMDDQNINALKRLAASAGQPTSKIYKITDFLEFHREDSVPDPYYSGDAGFEHVIDLLEDACEGLYKKLKNKEC